VGNTLSGSVENDSISLGSRQVMQGNAAATTTMTLGGTTDGVVNATTQAGGNSLAGGAYGAGLGINAIQSVDAGEITAGSSIRGGTARLVQGGSIGVAATANTVALGGTYAGFAGEIDQSSDASVRASNLVEAQYAPAELTVSSQALGNATAVNGTSVTYQDMIARQRSTGGIVEADTSANAGNAWDISGNAQATANQAVFVNQGGHLVAATDQSNTSYVRSTAVVTAYDYGSARSYAQGAGNAVSAGNNDIYLELDNTQLNSGGVEVRASFSGTNGYDAFVGADALGNSVTGYACSECEGQVNANNVQTNSGNVTATANTAVYGSGRAVITGTNAVGNAATFYVSRPACTTTCQ